MAEEEEHGYREPRKSRQGDDWVRDIVRQAIKDSWYRLGYNIDSDRHIETLQQALRWASEQAKITSEDKVATRRAFVGAIIGALVSAGVSTLILWFGLHWK